MRLTTQAYQGITQNDFIFSHLHDGHEMVDPRCEPNHGDGYRHTPKCRQVREIAVFRVKTVALIPLRETMGQSVVLRGGETAGTKKLRQFTFFSMDAELAQGCNGSGRTTEVVSALQTYAILIKSRLNPHDLGMRKGRSESRK